MWTRDADSCTGVTAYCSVQDVGYDISCGSKIIIQDSLSGIHVRAHLTRPARVKGFCPLGFFGWHRSAAPGERQAQHEGKSMMTALTWSDDRVEQLRKLWEGGLSASQIAAELGNVTRNAVIGKVHRLGLSGRAKSPSSAAPRPRKARAPQHMMRVVRPVSRGNTALAQAFDIELEPDPIAYDNVVPMSQRLSLLELSEATCHWPVGDPSSADFFFCGGKALASLPYCAHHSRIAYQPASDRRRQPPKPAR
jgi:GcrA cell cycle regulator